jgi:hypothetical protein
MSETPPPSYGPPPPFSEQDQRTYSTLIHILGIFFSFWPSLIGYLIAKNRGGFIHDHTRTALNFHITAIIGYVAGVILTFVLIGVFVLIAVAIVVVVFEIMGAIAANEGRLYKYPIAIEFIKN